MIIIEEEHYTEAIYSLTIKPNFSTFGSILKIFTQGPVLSFVPDDNTKDLLGFNKITIDGEYNLSQNPVAILSFNTIFLERVITQSIIFKGKRSGILHNFTMDVDPGYKYIENVRGVQWHRMESQDNISSISFNLKKEH